MTADAMTADDTKRFFSPCALGNVQAWEASKSEVSVALSVYMGVIHAQSDTAYAATSLNLTISDARDLAAALTKAADFAALHAKDGVLT